MDPFSPDNAFHQSSSPWTGEEFKGGGDDRETDNYRFSLFIVNTVHADALLLRSVELVLIQQDLSALYDAAVVAHEQDDFLAAELVFFFDDPRVSGQDDFLFAQGVGGKVRQRDPAFLADHDVSPGHDLPDVLGAGIVKYDHLIRGHRHSLFFELHLPAEGHLLAQFFRLHAVGGYHDGLRLPFHRRRGEGRGRQDGDGRDDEQAIPEVPP